MKAGQSFDHESSKERKRESRRTWVAAGSHFCRNAPSADRLLDFRVFVPSRFRDSLRTSCPFSGLLVLFVLFALPAPGRSAEKFDAASVASGVAPYVEKETIVVAHVDLARVSFAPSMALLARFMPESAAELSRGGEEATKPLDALRRSGAKELYFVASLSSRSILPEALLLVPGGAKLDQEQLRLAVAGLNFLPSPERWTREPRDGALVIPLSKFAQRAEIHPLARPELTEALAAAGEAAVQIVLIPPASSRRVIEELLPQLPPQIGGGPSTPLTRGISWAAVAIDLSPHLSAHLTIKSQDAEAAAALRAKWIEVLKLAGEQKEIKQALPEWEKAATMLTPRISGGRLVLVLDEKDPALGGLLTRSVRSARDAASRAQSINNLKQIGLAMLNYENAFKHFPAPAIHSRDGKPLLSWRVAVLPYIEQDMLYHQFHLDEPWDSPHNRPLIEKMPAVFRSPKSKAANGLTNYVVPVGGGALYSSLKDEPQIKDITDGTSKTIMVLEVDDRRGVVWTKPDDLPFDPQDPTKGIGGLYEDGFHATFCDGSVHFIRKTIDPKDLKALFTRAGGEVVGGY